MLTTVVGTLFSVEVIDGRTRVAVRRGRVDVVPDEAPEDAKGERQQLTPGEAWTEGIGHQRNPPRPRRRAGRARFRPPGLARARRSRRAGVAGDRGKTPDRRARRSPRPWPARPSAEPSRLNLDGAYAAAEGQLRAGNRANAREALQRLVARDPDGVHGEAARLNLARIALAAGDPAEARRQLRGMAEPTRDPALAETTHHLRCQAEVRLGAEGDATSCLQAFRRLYPDSPHDAEALALVPPRAPPAPTPAPSSTSTCASTRAARSRRPPWRDANRAPPRTARGRLGAGEDRLAVRAVFARDRATAVDGHTPSQSRRSPKQVHKCLRIGFLTKARPSRQM